MTYARVTNIDWRVLTIPYSATIATHARPGQDTGLEKAVRVASANGHGRTGTRTRAHLEL